MTLEAITGTRRFPVTVRTASRGAAVFNILWRVNVALHLLWRHNHLFEALRPKKEKIDAAVNWARS